MSVKILTRVFEHSKHKGTNRLALVVIADNADDQGFAYPGTSTIAHKMGDVSRRSVGNRIDVLSLSTELAVYPRVGHTNHYIVTVGMTISQVKQSIRTLAKQRKLDTKTLALMRHAYQVEAAERVAKNVRTPQTCEESSQPVAKIRSQGVRRSIRTIRHKPSVEPSESNGKSPKQASTPRERTDIEKAVIEGSWGIPGNSPLTDGFLVGQIVHWLRKEVPEEDAKQVGRFYRWYAKHYPGASAPRDLSKFEMNYRAFMAARAKHLAGEDSTVPTMRRPAVLDEPDMTPEQREASIRRLEEIQRDRQQQ